MQTVLPAADIPSTFHRLRQLLPATLFLLACHPVLLWYVKRSTDGSDEPLGLVALACVVGFLWMWRREWRLHPTRLLVGAGCMALIGIAPSLLPPLVKTIVAVLFLAWALQLPRGKSGVTTLVLLALPIVASLDFYSGYPFRIAAAEITSRLLWLVGISVERSGAVLLDSQNIVGVDPPCSGVRMLWGSLFVAAFLAARVRARLATTLCLILTALAVVPLGNALRAFVLFFPESGRVAWPAWTHEGVGLAIQAGVFLLLTVLATRAPSIKTQRSVLTAVQLISFVLLAFLGLGYFINRQYREATHSQVEWPSTLDGLPLLPAPLTPQEEAFKKGFPGDIVRFMCGEDEVVMRRVSVATRRMHSSADCLRAAGLRIGKQATERDADGRIWGVCQVDGPRGELKVKERITARYSDAEYTDVSAWYWNAQLRPEEGPWLSITLIQKVIR